MFIKPSSLEALLINTLPYVHRAITLKQLKVKLKWKIKESSTPLWASNINPRRETILIRKKNERGPIIGYLIVSTGLRHSQGLKKLGRRYEVWFLDRNKQFIRRRRNKATCEDLGLYYMELPAKLANPIPTCEHPTCRRWLKGRQQKWCKTHGKDTKFGKRRQRKAKQNVPPMSPFSVHSTHAMHGSNVPH